MLVSPFVGRDAELRTLVQAVARPPTVVLIDGEAGVGKTRLVSELLRGPQLAGRRTLTGHCQPLREPFPYGPVVEALSRAADTLPPPAALDPVTGALRALLPELADRLPPPLPDSGDPRTDRHRLFRATLALLNALGPAVVVLEDLHWIDPGTQDLLGFLARHLPPALSLVVTFRREDLPPTSPLSSLVCRLPRQASCIELTLSPLSTDEVRQLVAGILQTDVSPEFASALQQRTMGLPFAIEEVLRALGGTQRNLDSLAVPAPLRESLLERLRRLGPRGRAVVHAAAVLGVPAPEELLGCVAGVSGRRAAHALGEALAHALLWPTESGRYGFRHTLARQAMYDALSEPERRELHARTVRALQTHDPKPYAQLAHHSLAAGQTRNWLRYAEAAADLASSRGDEPAATAFLRDVLRTPDLASPTRMRVAVKLGRAALNGLSHDEVVTVLREVLAEEQLPAGVRGELRLALGLILNNQAGQSVAGRAEIARAVTDLRRRPALAARALSALAVPKCAPEHVDEHLRWLRAAQALVDRIRDPALRAAVLVNQATTMLQVGDPAAWQAVSAVPDHADSPAERLQLSRGACNIGDACVLLGHLHRAERFLTRGLSLAEASGAAFMTSIVTVTALRLDWALGRWTGLADRAADTASLFASVPMVAAEARLVSGLLALAHGDLSRAEGELRAVSAIDSPDSAVTVAAGAAAGLGRLLLVRGDAAQAREVTGGAMEAIRRKGIWVWSAELAPTAVVALLADGRPAQARDLVAEIGAGLRGRDSPYAQAALALCQAELGGDGFEVVQRRYRALPRPYDAAQAAERAGPHGLMTALSRYSELGATWDAARCRRLLRDNGLAVPHRRGRRGYGNALSPREREVVLLVTSGRTNRQIADALFLSERTVEEHVANAIRKLNVASRRELAKDPYSLRVATS